MDITPYLHFNGQCAEAFRFYAECLGGTIEMTQTFGESPMKDQVPPDWRDKIIHISLTVDRQVLMGSDAPPPHYVTPQGFAVSIMIDDYAKAERTFGQLAAGGRVTMPFAKTYWAAGFGMATDRFGTPWMINCTKA